MAITVIITPKEILCAYQLDVLRLSKHILAELDKDRLTVSARAVCGYLAELEKKVQLHYAWNHETLYPALLGFEDVHIQALIVHYKEDLESLTERFNRYAASWQAEDTVRCAPDIFIEETRSMVTTLATRLHSEQIELYSKV